MQQKPERKKRIKEKKWISSKRNFKIEVINHILEETATSEGLW